VNHPTMPDPFAPPGQIWPEVTEVPIREVISRLAALAGGPLAEYVAEASRSHSIGAAADDVTAALDHLLMLWDDRERLATPEQVAATVDRHNARQAIARVGSQRRQGAPAPIGPYPGRPDLEERAERKRAEFITSKPLPQRQLTADQAEAAERHRRAQAGES
jgi:hypothetical protein